MPSWFSNSGKCSIDSVKVIMFERNVGFIALRSLSVKPSLGLMNPFMRITSFGVNREVSLTPSGIIMYGVICVMVAGSFMSSVSTSPITCSTLAKASLNPLMLSQMALDAIW